MFSTKSIFSQAVRYQATSCLASSCRAILVLAGLSAVLSLQAQGLDNAPGAVQAPADAPALQSETAPGMEDQNGPLRARWNTDRLRTGDPLQLSLSMTVPPGNKVLWPDWSKPPVEGLELMTSRADTTAEGINRYWTFQHFDTGLYQFPPQAVSLVRNGDTISFATKALDFQVSDVPIDTAEGIRPIKGPQEVTYRRFPWFLVFILAAFALLVAGIFLYRRFAKRKAEPAEPEARPVPRKPVDEHAFERLRALEKKRLWQQGQVSEYYVELADILREYVEFRYNVPALESPTGETMQRLAAHDLPAPSAEALAHALRLADMVKFARANPLTDQHQRVFRDAEAFVEATRPRPVEESSAAGGGATNGSPAASVTKSTSDTTTDVSKPTSDTTIDGAKPSTDTDARGTTPPTAPPTPTDSDKPPVS